MMHEETDVSSLVIETAHYGLHVPLLHEGKTGQKVEEGERVVFVVDTRILSRVRVFSCYG